MQHWQLLPVPSTVSLPALHRNAMSMETQRDKYGRLLAAVFRSCSSEAKPSARPTAVRPLQEGAGFSWLAGRAAWKTCQQQRPGRLLSHTLPVRLGFQGAESQWQKPSRVWPSSWSTLSPRLKSLKAEECMFHILVLLLASCCRTDRRTDKWVMDPWTDGQMDGWIQRRTEKSRPSQGRVLQVTHPDLGRTRTQVKRHEHTSR